MRPKKLILCVAADEQALSELTFMLRTYRYPVLSASSGLEAIGLFSDAPVGLVVAHCEMPQMSGLVLVKRLKQIAPHVPMLLLGTASQRVLPHHGDRMLVRPSMSELLETVKAMTARKRWTRKRTVLSVGIEREAVCA